jgi:hypothetical protein
MKNSIVVFLIALMSISYSVSAQKKVDIDGRLQPILNEFLAECKKYGIDCDEKLFQLKKVDITNTLPLEEGNTVLGMVTRDANNNVDGILINWVAMIDPDMLKVIAFHEFAHHFLDYKHTCQECNEIMAVVNTSYFDVAYNWKTQVENLFMTSPVYLAKEKKDAMALSSFQ